MLIDITIPGKPIPNNTKAWFNPKTKRIMMYKPTKVKEYKEKVNKAISDYMDYRGIAPISGPVSVYLYINIKIPKSYNKKKRLELLNGYELGSAPAMTKPDLDNCQKIIIDAISKDQWNKGSYLLENDSQICSIHVYKFYAEESSIRLMVNRWGAIN